MQLSEPQDCELGGRAVDTSRPRHAIGVIVKGSPVALVADQAGRLAEHVAISEAGALVDPMLLMLDRVPDRVRISPHSGVTGADAGHVVLWVADALGPRSP